MPEEIRPCMITTTDNPYNPFTQYDEWLAFDESIKGYYTNNYLARIARTSVYFSPEVNREIINNAIDEIIVNDTENLYKKVYEDD